MSITNEACRQTSPLGSEVFLGFFSLDSSNFAFPGWSGRVAKVSYNTPEISTSRTVFARESEFVPERKCLLECEAVVYHKPLGSTFSTCLHLNRCYRSIPVPTKIITPLNQVFCTCVSRRFRSRDKTRESSETHVFFLSPSNGGSPPESIYFFSQSIRMSSDI